MTSIKARQEKVQGEDLAAAQQTIQAFVKAFKSFSLYPEDHIFCRTNLEKFTSELHSFLGDHEGFPLGIEKNCFFYEEAKIFEGPPEESNPAHLLTRDGLIHLEFLQGIDSSEIKAFFKILNQHRSAGDESGGDIVTSLWQAEFKHMEYEEVDIFALESFSFDLGELKASPDGRAMDIPAAAGLDRDKSTLEYTSGERAGTQDAPELNTLSRSETVTNLLRMENALKVLEIRSEEKAILQSYVEAEEQKDYTSDIIDVLLIILVSQKNRVHFGQVLAFLEDVFFDCLDQGDFYLAHKICSNVLTIGNQIKAIRPWTLELVDGFILSLSLEERWRELSWCMNPYLLVARGREDQKLLWQIFRMLAPEIMFVLGPLMTRIGTENIDIRNELFELVSSNAKQHPDKFADFLAGSDADINLLLFPLVEDLARHDAETICLQMTRHEAVEVRRTGLNGYFTYTAAPDIEALFPLLYDVDDVVVGKLLTFLLDHVEQEEVENLLLRFLKKATSDGIDHPHMFEYYKALSQCGSTRSVKLLTSILMESRLTEMFSNMNSVNKKGSALALKILGTEEAMMVLRSGLKSMRPDIRLACQFALGKER